jgi:hypothetical protein
MPTKGKEMLPRNYVQRFLVPERRSIARKDWALAEQVISVPYRGVAAV